MILMATFFPATQCTPSFTKPISSPNVNVNVNVPFLFPFFMKTIQTKSALRLTGNGFGQPLHTLFLHSRKLLPKELTGLSFPKGFIHSVGTYILTRIYTAAMVIALHCAVPEELRIKLLLTQRLLLLFLFLFTDFFALQFLFLMYLSSSIRHGRHVIFTAKPHWPRLHQKQTVNLRKVNGPSLLITASYSLWDFEKANVSHRRWMVNSLESSTESDSFQQAFWLINGCDMEEKGRSIHGRFGAGAETSTLCPGCLSTVGWPLLFSFAGVEDLLWAPSFYGHECKISLAFKGKRAFSDLTIRQSDPY